MIDLPCIRCLVNQASDVDWLHCEACWQLECDEAEEARREIDDARDQPGTAS